MKSPSSRIGQVLGLALTLALGAGDGLAASVFGTVSGSPQVIPIQGARVSLRHLPTKQADTLLTDSAGAYHFSDVTGCDRGCDIEVSDSGSWYFTSDYFEIGADGVKQVDVVLEPIKSLTVRVVKAEDTAEVIPASQAVLFSMDNEPPRCVKIDSTGNLRFTGLHSLTGYLLSVSAPGRKTNSNMLHLHDPVANIHWRAVLDSDVAGSNKALRGTLSVKGKGPAAGERVLLDCRTDQAADLFTQTGPDGGYAIEGVPADCDSVKLYAGYDSAMVAIPDKENQFDWSAVFPEILAISPGRDRKAQAGWLPAPWRGYDLAGRKRRTFTFGRGPNRP